VIHFGRTCSLLHIPRLAYCIPDRSFKRNVERACPSPCNNYDCDRVQQFAGMMQSAGNVTCQILQYTRTLGGRSQSVSARCQSRRPDNCLPSQRGTSWSSRLGDIQMQREKETRRTYKSLDTQRSKTGQECAGSHCAAIVIGFYSLVRPLLTTEEQGMRRERVSSDTVMCSVLFS
jgi:hypothetical protein